MKRGYTMVGRRTRTSLILAGVIIFAGCGDSDVVSPDVDTSSACVDYANTMHWSGRVYNGYGGVVVPGVSVFRGDSGYFLKDVAQDGQVTFVASHRGKHGAVAGDLAYMSNGDGLAVLDVSSPSSPAVLATLALGAVGGDITLSGSFAYLPVGVGDDAAPQVGLQIVDVSNPNSPALAGRVTWNDPNLDIYEFGAHVTVAGPHAYVAAGDLKIIDVANPGAPAITSHLPVSASDVVVDGSYAYVVGHAGLHVIDVSVPHAPALVATVAEGGGRSLTIDNLRAYVVDEGSLKAFDLSAATSPRPLATVGLWSGAFDIVLAGSHAFVISDALVECYEGPRGLQVVRLPAGAKPRAVGRIRVEGTVIGANGAFAYTVTGWGRDEEPVFRVIDASSASAPRLAGRVAFNHNATAAIVDGAYVYLATEGGLEIIDASNPAVPRVAALVGTNGIGDVQVSGNHAYVLGESDITIIDVSSISSPVVVGSIEAPRYANRVLVGDKQLIVGAVNVYHNEVPLTVYDISEPTNPLVAFEHPDWCWEFRDMAVWESYLCILYSHDDNRLLQVYDISARAEPIHIGEVELYSAWEIASISGRRAFLAGGTIVDLSGPGAFKLLGNIPIAGYAFEGTSGLYTSADGFFQIFPSPCD